jgi:type IV secretion system protein TrbB
LGIVEVMLNSDDRLWIDRLAGGLSDTGKRLSAEDGEAHRARRRRSW